MMKCLVLSAELDGSRLASLLSAGRLTSAIMLGNKYALSRYKITNYKMKTDKGMFPFSALTVGWATGRASGL